MEEKNNNDHDYDHDDNDDDDDDDDDTFCHFWRQSAPLGRLKAQPLNSGCHGVPDDHNDDDANDNHDDHHHHHWNTDNIQVAL